VALAGANHEILLVTDSDFGATHVFFFNSGTGELTEATGSPIETGTAPFGLNVIPVPRS
jgi:hypothetical protein